ncbi:MAG: DUF4263 domain-containing protein [Saprospiraceae bacterium]
MATYTPSKENITVDDASKTVYEYCDNIGTPIFKARELFKGENRLVIYPYFANRRTNAISLGKIKKIEFIGWSKFDDIPDDFKSKRSGEYYYGIKSTRLRQLLKAIYPKFPELENLAITLGSGSRFSKKTITLKWNDIESTLNSIAKEISYHNKNRKLLINNSLAILTTKFTRKSRDIYYNELKNFLEKFDTFEKLTDSDVESLSKLFDGLSKSKITVTANFIKTKDRINVAYLEDILEEFEKLMAHSNDNEKKWQDFFAKHSWIFSHLFPYEVILRQREAYVGGKTIENADGKIVDFLYQNGFKDNYALIEIKTHNKDLLKNSPYRGTDVYPLSDDLSGGINQCLDQKDNFIKEFGKAMQPIDPKVILIIGKRSNLKPEQMKCFELLRGNQKNVDIVTFDEVQKKLEGLLNVINIK